MEREERYFLEVGKGRWTVMAVTGLTALLDSYIELMTNTLEVGTPCCTCDTGLFVEIAKRKRDRDTG